MSRKTFNILIALGLLLMAGIGLWFSAYKDVNVLTVVSIILGAVAGNRIRAAREEK
jgi:hypothetical protein